MRCHGCHTTLIEIRTRTGTADKSVCYGFITDEFEPDGPKYWTTYRLTYNYEGGGSHYYQETHSGDIIDTSDPCPDVVIEDTYDPLEDYGTLTGTTETYSGAVSLAAVFAAALADITWGATSSVVAIGTLSPSSWHGVGTSGAGMAADGGTSGGTRATVSLTQVQFRARGYLKLPVKIEFEDTEAVPYSITLPSNGDWTTWQGITPQQDKVITLGPITAKMGKYA